MKSDPWRQLVAVAKQAPAVPEAEMPFGFDTRVVAGWRSRSTGTDGLPWALFLRGAMVCSTVIMLLSLVVNYETTRESEPTAVAIVDSAFFISLAQ